MEPWELHAWHADFLDACNRHDLSAIGEFIDPQVRRAHQPSGIDAWLDDLAMLFRAFPDWKWRRIQLVAEDDRIAAHLRGNGTHLGEYRGIAPTRAHANVAEFWILRVRRGRVTEVTGSGDHELRARLGA